MRLFNLFGLKTKSVEKTNDINFRLAIVSKTDLFRKGFTGMLGDTYPVLFSGRDGEELVATMNASNLPDFVMLDIDRNLEDAIHTCKWIKENHPTIKIIALTINSDRDPVDKMLENGACGYFLKSIEPRELKSALKEIRRKGYFLHLPLELLYRTEISNEELKRMANKFGFKIN